jgi:ssDNA thymidine ADP-ribosyltransferase, DarT
VPRPDRPKIFHVLHVDRLPSVIADGCLWSDAEMVNRPGRGTVVGMSDIKRRRLTELTLTSHPGLYVGRCVPFYLCPRSVMLYILHKANHPALAYRGGEGPIVHLQADLHAAVEWATGASHRWAFTLSNAGSYYFEDRADLAQRDEVDWNAVAAQKWSGPGVPAQVEHGKQAEFLVEGHLPWELVERIGVRSQDVAQRVIDAFRDHPHHPAVEVRKDWYYGS